MKLNYFQEEYIFTHLIVYHYFFEKDFSIKIDPMIEQKIQIACKNSHLSDILYYTSKMSWQYSKVQNNLSLRKPKSAKEKKNNNRRKTWSKISLKSIFIIINVCI